MKTLLINGSPRPNGNTRLIVERCANKLEEQGIETEIVQLGSGDTHGCTGCMMCLKNKDKECVIKDDVNECIKKMVEADAIIIGSPTYFANVSSEVKALIDRAGMVGRVNGFIYDKKIGAPLVAVCNGGALPVGDAINRLFQINKMIIPCSTYWNFAVGLKPGEAANDSRGMANVDDLADSVAWLLKKIKA